MNDIWLTALFRKDAFTHANESSNSNSTDYDVRDIDQNIISPKHKTRVSMDALNLIRYNEYTKRYSPLPTAKPRIPRKDIENPPGNYPLPEDEPDSSPVDLQASRAESDFSGISGHGYDGWYPSISFFSDTTYFPLVYLVMDTMRWMYPFLSDTTYISTLSYDFLLSGTKSRLRLCFYRK